MSDIGIIGGADGPTAIFVASEVPMIRIIGIVAAVVVIVAAVIVTLVLATRNKEQ